MATSPRVAEPSKVSSQTKVTKESELIPGILYCLFEVTQDADGTPWNREGALVYWTGGTFMDEDGDVRYDDWDYAIACSTKSNQEYVFA